MELKGVTNLKPESFQVIELADTDFANCRKTRRSVGSSIITIGGWQSITLFPTVHVKPNIKKWPHGKVDEQFDEEIEELFGT